MEMDRKDNKWNLIFCPSQRSLSREEEKKEKNT